MVIDGATTTTTTSVSALRAMTPAIEGTPRTYSAPRNERLKVRGRRPPDRGRRHHEHNLGHRGGVRAFGPGSCSSYGPLAAAGPRPRPARTGYLFRTTASRWTARRALSHRGRT